jgi:hypothetical protein
MKNIWMVWFQGIDSQMPRINKICIEKWISLNKKFKVNLLCDKTIKKFVPEYEDIVNSSPPRSYAAKSDLLRLLLLKKFGGVWVDASVFPMKPLDQFYDHLVNETGFFSYRFIPRVYNEKCGDREIVSWFICLDKNKGENNHLIEVWLDLYIEIFKTGKNWRVFTIHDVFCKIYDSDTKIKNIVENMVQVSQHIPHSACVDNKKTWQERIDSHLYKRPPENLDY